MEYAKKNYINLNMDVFGYLMNEWWYDQGEYKLFCKHFAKIRYTSEYFDNRAKVDREYDTKWRCADRAFDAIDSVCNILNLRFAVSRGISRKGDDTMREAIKRFLSLLSLGMITECRDSFGRV